MSHKKYAKNMKEKKIEMDKAGFFHPAANAMRVESAFQNELQKRLSLDEIEGKVLDEMLRESRGEVINKKSSALDSKFDNLLKRNNEVKKQKKNLIKLIAMAVNRQQSLLQRPNSRQKEY